MWEGRTSNERHPEPDDNVILSRAEGSKRNVTLSFVEG